MEKKTFLVTGATGYIGFSLIKHLLSLDSNNVHKIVGVYRDESKLKQHSEILNHEKVKFVRIESLDNDCLECILREMNLEPDYIIHCAAMTQSLEMVKRPVEVIESIVNTTQHIMELAKNNHAKSVVYLSSMEVYGDVTCTEDRFVSEDTLGNIDILNSRSCYPLAKRMAENICYSYYAEYSVPVKIVRLAQTFGNGILKTDNRVFAQFARAVQNNHDIVLHTNGNSMGNYCGITDVISAIMILLERGKNGEAYNVTNEENTMTIKEMAMLVADKVADGNIRVVFDIPDENVYGYAQETGLKLSSEKLRRLGWAPTKNLEDMYREILQ